MSDQKTFIRERDGMNWYKFGDDYCPDEGDDLPYMLIGGEPKEDFLQNWPHFKGVPLPFFGDALFHDKQLNIFLGETEEESWELEDGANCVSVNGNFPHWIETKPVSEPILFAENYFGTYDHLDEPEWLQGDELPDGYVFVAQVPSQIDGGQLINIGDGFGTAYVFMSDDNESARMVWQS